LLTKLSEHIKYFIKNKWYMLSLVVSAIAGYGYQLGHGTCGIDDIVIDMYFEDGLGVAIGRWPFYYINKVINIAEYTPFITDFIAVLLLMLAAVIWCALFREIMKDELPVLCYSIFSAMFLVYSLIAEVFIYYLHNGIAIIYCLTGISLFGFYYLWTNKISAKRKLVITLTTILMMCVSISFYESAANLYLFGALLVIFVDCIQEKRMDVEKWKKAIASLGYVALILVAAIVGRTIVTRFTMEAFSIKEYFFRSVSSIEWLTSGNLRSIYVNLVMLIKALVKEYFAVGVVYYPILLFALATVFFIVFVIYKAITGKNIWVFLYGLATYASLYVLALIQCDTLKYRSCQMFSVFVGFIMMIMTYIVMKQKGWIKTVGIIFIAGMVVYSAIDLNGWFIYDYEKNQIELQIVQKIGQDLQSGEYDIENKPVVFVGDFFLDEEILDKSYIEEGEWGWPVVKWANEWMEMVSDSYCFTQILDLSLIEWGIEGLAEYGGYNRPLQSLFEYCGYSFIWAESELYEEIMPVYYDYYGPGYEYMKTESYGAQEQYPYDGYIEETEEYIVVRL